MSMWLFYLTGGLSLLLMAILVTLIYRARGGLSRSGLALLKLLPALVLRRDQVSLRWKELLETVRQLSTGENGRYKTPWLIVIGEPGSGRSRLFKAAGEGGEASWLKRLARFRSHAEQWNVMSHGVLIDAQPPCSESNPEVSVEGVLDDLNQLRPERPLDGVVLTLSADTLLDGGRDNLSEVAKQLKGLLWQCQKLSEFSLPVYVVITRTDYVPGYRAFWELFPEHQQQVFGWSVEERAGTPRVENWVHQGFGEIVGQLYQMQAARLARVDDLTDDLDASRDFVLFPQRLAGLKCALEQVLAEVFDHSAWESAAMLRGFYFTGELGPEAPLLNIDELVSQKLFAERNLAQPLRSALLSRNRRLRQLQLVSLWGLGSLFASLALSGWQLKQQSDATLESIQLVDTMVGQVGQLDNCSRTLTSAQLEQLLAEMGDVQGHASKWNLPASWVDKQVERRVASHLADRALEQLIYPALRCRLQSKAEALLKPDGILANNAVAQADGALYGMLNQLLRFEQNLALYNQLIRDNPTEHSTQVVGSFVQLVSYLFDKPLPAELVGSNSMLLPALASVSYARNLILPESFYSRTYGLLAERSIQLADALTDEVNGGLELLRVVSRAEGGSPQAASGLLTWRNRIEEGWLQVTAGHTPCGRNNAQLEQVLNQLRRDYHYPAVVLAKVIEPFQRARCEAPLQARLATAQLRPGVALIAHKEGRQDWTAQAEAELDQLETLLDQPFMALAANGTASCVSGGAEVDSGPVRQLLGYLHSYQLLQRETPLLKAAAPGSLVSQLAREQMVRVIEAQMSEALQSPESDVDIDRHVARLSRAVGNAEGDLVTLLRLSRQLGFDPAGSHWLNCVNTTASQQLREIEQLFDDSQLFMPMFSDRDSGLLYPRLTDRKQVRNYLDTQQREMIRLVGLARPWTRWLRQRGNDATLAVQGIQQRWIDTVAQMDRALKQDDQHSPYVQLEDYFKQLAGLTFDSCGELSAPSASDWQQDLFSYRQHELYSQTQDLCYQGREGLFRTRYRSLADGFNQLLAGRFPFADTTAPDLAPARWQQFSERYGKQLTALTSEIADMDGDQWPAAYRFLRRLGQAQQALDPLLSGSDPAVLRLQTMFRRDAPRRNGEEQIVEWSLGNASDRIVYPNGGSEFLWRPGEPLQLDLNWAELSLQRPRQDPSQSDMQVMGPKARFQAQGSWALLRLIERHREELDSQRGEAKLRFHVPVMTADSQGGGEAEMLARATEARLQFDLSIKTPGTNLWQPWHLAAEFPRQAPDLTQE